MSIEEQYKKENPIRDVVIIALKNNNNQILLVRTHKLPEKWQPIGGGIDKYEAPINAIIREVMEELKINLEKDKLEHIGIVPYDFGIGNIHCFNYKCIVDEKQLIIDESEILEYRWFSLKESLKLNVYNATKLFLKRLTTLQQL